MLPGKWHGKLKRYIGCVAKREKRENVNRRERKARREKRDLAHRNMLGEGAVFLRTDGGIRRLPFLYVSQPFRGKDDCQHDSDIFAYSSRNSFRLPRDLPAISPIDAILDAILDACKFTSRRKHFRSLVFPSVSVMTLNLTIIESTR